MPRTQCPANTVDEHAARIVATIVVAAAVASLWPPLRFLVAALAIDFVIRGFVDRRYSPLRFLAKGITGVLGWEPKPVYAPPKRFAAQIGATFTVVATALHLAGLHIGADVATAFLVVAASLEAGFGFCLACWIYPLVFRGRSQASA